MKLDSLDTILVIALTATEISDGLTMFTVLKIIFGGFLTRSLQRKTKYYSSVCFLGFISVVTGNLSDLMCFGVILYIAPSYLNLNTVVSIQLFLAILINWLILSGFFRTEPHECLFLTFLMATSLIQHYYQQGYDDLAYKLKDISLNNHQLKQKLSELDTKSSSRDSPLASQRTSRLAEKLKRLAGLNNPQLLKSLSEPTEMSCSEEGELMSFNPEFVHCNSGSSNNSSNFSSPSKLNSLANEDIKELITNLISHEYLI